MFSLSPHLVYKQGGRSSFCSPAEGNIVLGQLRSPRPHGPPSQTWGDTWESFIFVYTPLQVCLLVREPQDHLEDARKTPWTCPGSGQRSGSCPVRSGLFLLSRRFVFSFLLKTPSQGSQRESPTPRLWARALGDQRALNHQVTRGASTNQAPISLFLSFLLLPMSDQHGQCSPQALCFPLN